MFSANPVLRRNTGNAEAGAITFDGIIHRTGILIILTMLGFAVSWEGMGGGVPGMSPGTALLLTLGGCLTGLLLCLLITFTSICNPILIGVYALAEGLFLGGISFIVELEMPGIAFQTAATTFGLFLGVLALYKTGIIKATPGLTKFILGALFAIALLYLVDMVARLFGAPLSILHGNGMMSILVSCGIVTIAAISFILDFAEAEQAVEEGVSADYAWRIGFGLLVGLVWLYLEVLRLLMKLRSRD